MPVGTKPEKSMNIAIIGAGITGIAAASILKKAGHSATLFEKSDKVGGVWAVGYPGVCLQNTAHQYTLAEFPWPFKPAHHPTAADINKYLNLAVTGLGLELRNNSEVVGLVENVRGWTLTYRNDAGNQEQQFDYVIAAIGQYTEGKHKPDFPGQATFRGELITERDITSLDLFNGKRTVVVGFGKSAVDIATMAAAKSAQVYHVFRTPRWMIPFTFFRVHYTHLLFCRLSTILMPCWAHPTKFERFFHRNMGFLVDTVWYIISRVVILLCKWQGLFKGSSANNRLNTLIPTHAITGDLRSASALTPRDYFRLVASGRIEPYHAEISRLSDQAVHFRDGRSITCDQVVLCVGSEAPRFPFLPDKYRRLLESEDDGVQLYRHVLHPDIPRFACAGYNHGFMHVPSAEIGMLWLCAHLNGELLLPSREEMLRCIETIREWKRKYINYEPSRSCAVNTRFQQYLDILLKELGVSPYRKMPNIFAEIFGQYGAEDYRGVVDEYLKQSRRRDTPLTSLPLDT